MLNQIQPLYLQCVPAEHLQRRGHVRYLVPALHDHFLLQFAPGHPAHPVREERQPPKQYPPHKEPVDEQRSCHTHDADCDEELAPGADGLVGRECRLLRMLVR